jgi:hypothetical protein
MRRHALWLLLGLTGCARGCAEEPRPSPTPAQSTLTPVLTPNQKVEQDLGIRLPDRRTSQIIPGLTMLPWRKLTDFDPGKALVARLDAKGLNVLGEATPLAGLTDDAVRATLRKAAEAWRLRAGVQANRLVLAIDADTPAQVVMQVRREALVAGQWRVVTLARDGDVLVELMLNPPPMQRPAP